MRRGFWFFGILIYVEIKEEDLKKLILESGAINRSDLETLAKKAKEKKQKLGDILLSEGKIGETDLRRMEAHALGIPYVNLGEQKIDLEVLALIPEPIARNYNIVEIGRASCRERV